MTQRDAFTTQAAMLAVWLLIAAATAPTPTWGALHSAAAAVFAFIALISEHGPEIIA